MNSVIVVIKMTCLVSMTSAAMVAMDQTLTANFCQRKHAGWFLLTMHSFLSLKKKLYIHVYMYAYHSWEFYAFFGSNYGYNFPIIRLLCFYKKLCFCK